MADSTSLIIAIKGCKDIEIDGHIIRIGNGANTNTVRALASEKLGLAIPLEDILLETSTGEVLTEIDQVKLQQTIYINFPEQVKDVIPGPRRLPMVGNLYEMMPDLSAGWAKQFAKYGNLTSVSILGFELVATNDPAIAEIFVKESEFFTKKVGAAFVQIKEFAGNGLFTSNTDDDEWKLAHKILMPAFSPRAIKAYQPEMGHIAQETMKVLAEYSPEDKVEILDWTTNLTFETIGRIGFGYSFDLMDRNKPSHPFINAMGYALQNSIVRFTRPNFMNKLPIESNRTWQREICLMRSIVEEVIVERKNSEFAKDTERDLLGFMLNARDEHDSGLSDENIRDQVITFLIAGHDTTSNTLAWTFYELARNPDIQAKVLQEIANAGITSDELPTVEQISSLKYLSQVLKETLRCHSPLRALNKYCKKDCVVPGGYRIKEGTSVIVSTLNMHMNPDVYANPTKYDPDRWTPEEEQKRSRYAWLPFSTGPRACIGMAFALQEAKTVISMFLHRFDFKYDGPAIPYDPYQPTTKPLDLFMNIHPRTNFPEPNEDIVNQNVNQSVEKVSMPVLDSKAPSVGTVDLPRATFLYGTQTGSAQDYANQLASQARRFGFKDVTFCSMDQWQVIQSGKYEKKHKDEKKNELVVICTATYNGYPPDSAEKFDKFLDVSKQASKEDLLNGINYAVFGLGNKNWRTYQAFPIKVDSCLNDLGANRFFTPGTGDADKDMDGEFNQWCAHFWTHTLGRYGVAASASKSVVPTATLSAEDSSSSTVKVNFIPPSDSVKWKYAKENKNGEYNSKLMLARELQKAGSDRSTRHMEIDISKLESVSSHQDHLYEAGDHIEIMPENSVSEVERIALGFGLVLDSVFEIDTQSVEGLSPRSLAASITGPCTVRNALIYYADLLSPPSRRMLSFFAAQLHAIAPETAEKFDSLTMPDENNNDQYPEFIKKHRTLLDLQMAYPQVNRIDLGQFLTAVGTMQPRRYSIASSPLVHPHSAHISVGVVNDLVGDVCYPGLASSYLSRLSAGESLIRASLKSSKSTFAMPTDITKPLIMIAAGTGLAPFRGFLQERAYQKSQGQNVGPCLLFFGCRNPEKDYIYQEELEAYVESGVLIKNHVAFSRLVPSASQKYVQHALLANAGEVWSYILNENGEHHGSIYICGSGYMSRDVCSTLQILFKSFGVAKDDEEAEDFLQTLVDEKNLQQDVWG